MNIVKINVVVLVCLFVALMPALATETTIAQWTFESTVPTTAGPVSPEIGSGKGTALHSAGATYSNPKGNGSTQSWSANNWSAGDYWQFGVNTTGFGSIQISFDQYGSSTGPRDFAIEYSTDGSYFTPISDYALSAADDWDSSSFNLTSIGNLNNDKAVYFRLMDTDATSIGRSTVGTRGTDRIDNFIVKGNRIPNNVPSSTPGIVGLTCILGLMAVWQTTYASDPR